MLLKLRMLLTFFAPRRLPQEKLKVVKVEFNCMLKLGISRPSSYWWASPLHIVLKRSGDLHSTLNV